MRKAAVILFYLFSALSVHADGVASVNYDIRTEAAMTAALTAEYETERINKSKVNEMYKHYASASLATAGIYMTKYMDRNSPNIRGCSSGSSENPRRINSETPVLFPASM